MHMFWHDHPGHQPKTMPLPSPADRLDRPAAAALRPKKRPLLKTRESQLARMPKTLAALQGSVIPRIDRLGRIGVHGAASIVASRGDHATPNTMRAQPQRWLRPRTPLPEAREPGKFISSSEQDQQDLQPKRVCVGLPSQKCSGGEPAS
jgi:hypothetical protein